MIIDFNPSIYQNLHNDLIHMTDDEASNHFLNFGIVPAFMMYIKYESITHNKLYWVCCVVYIICAALRLARFSVNGLSVDNTFSGLPSTGGAFLVTMPLCLEYCKFGISKTILAYFSMLLLIFIAIMMVASMQVFSLSRIKIHHNVFPFLFIALAIVLSLLNSYTWHIIIFLQILYVAMLFILSPGKNKNIK
jgi:CDP-diacylglycerol--serine O-phosphatidyltransferase